MGCDGVDVGDGVGTAVPEEPCVNEGVLVRVGDGVGVGDGVIVALPDDPCDGEETCVVVRVTLPVAPCVGVAVGEGVVVALVERP